MGLPRYVPVLHLHGRVGWYLRDDGTIHDFIATTGYSKQWGSPVVMWPDDEKDASSYNAAPAIAALWDDFVQALQRARRVLVLGHSLNDPFLVEALQQNVVAERLAITVCWGNQEALHHDTADVRNKFPGCIVVPLLFGPEPRGEFEQLGTFRGSA